MLTVIPKKNSLRDFPQRFANSRRLFGVCTGSAEARGAQRLRAAGFQERRRQDKRRNPKRSSTNRSLSVSALASSRPGGVPTSPKSGGNRGQVRLAPSSPFVSLWAACGVLVGLARSYSENDKTATPSSNTGRAAARLCLLCTFLILNRISRRSV